jgi:hypothetical protein
MNPKVEIKLNLLAGMYTPNLWMPLQHSVGGLFHASIMNSFLSVSISNLWHIKDFHDIETHIYKHLYDTLQLW